MTKSLFLVLALATSLRSSPLFTSHHSLATASQAVVINAAEIPRRDGLLKARQGTTTITSACTDDSDCASGCCGFANGVCQGPCVALQRAGCGFGDAMSNSNAAAQLGACSSLVADYVPSALAAGPGTFIRRLISDFSRPDIACLPRALA